MYRWFALVCLGLLAPSAVAQPNPNIAPTPPLSPEEQLKKFHLPPGFVIELVAAEPKVKKPINIAFDAWGNLFVTESVEYPFPAKDDQGKDSVKVLSDFAPDGRARRIDVYADGLNIPIGVLPLYKMEKEIQGRKAALERPALIYSIPNIWFVGPPGLKQPYKEALFTGFGFQDTHGMTGEFTWGMDGWVYCCHGFANQSKVKGPDGTMIAMQSGNTYRIKPDGSRLEQYTWGQVNPFGLSIDPLGNLYSADCHTRPVYQLIKGAYYPSFGKPHDGLGFGPEMVTHDHGSTANCGIVYYAADQFPKEFRDNLFIGNVITNRVNRDRIEWHGSSPKGIEMPDLVKCDDPWFRPVDIKLGPDGCLYVADFYNRIIGHYEVPLNHPGRDREKGRIWRIVYRGDNQSGPQPVKELPRLPADELIAELGHPNLAVRVQATNVLAVHCAADAKLAAQVQEVARTGKGVRKAHAMWTLQRCGRLSEKIVADSCKEGDRLVYVQALKIIGAMKKLTPFYHALLVAGLNDGDVFVQRAAAEALGDHPAVANVAPLLQLRKKVPASDTHLTHVVRIALRNQFINEKLAAEMPREWNDGDHRTLADVLTGVKAGHVVGIHKDYLARREDTPGNYQRFAHHIVRYGEEGDGAWVLNLARTRFASNLGFQAGLVKTVGQARQERGAGFSKDERARAEEVAAQCLTSPDRGVILAGIDLAGLFALRGTSGTLWELVKDSRQPEDLRKSAVAGLVRMDPVGQLKDLQALLARDGEPLPLREQAAISLAATNIPEAHAALLKTLEAAPARLQNSIGLALAGSADGANRLLDAIQAGKASRRLLQEQAVVQRLQQSKAANVKDRIATLAKGLPPADVLLAKKFDQRRAAYLKNPGDPAKGLVAFEKHCAACHVVANKGSKIGPQLDGIGIRGLERLLEDLLDPSRNVDQAFRATTLELENGQFQSGLLLREEGEVYVLVDAQGKEARVPRKNVREKIQTNLSPMPANLIDTIIEADFNHLMAYLLAQRVKE